MMRAERDPMRWKDAGASALGAEERSDEAPRAGAGPASGAPDPEVVAKPTRRQFTAEYRLRIPSLPTSLRQRLPLELVEGG